MDVAAVYLDMFDRIAPYAGTAVKGVDLDHLTKAPEPGANTIAWLVWHLARIQDHHVADLFDRPQVWVEGDWAGHFGQEPDPANTGYGHTTEMVLSVRPDRPQVLLEYLNAVYQRTRPTLAGLVAADLDRIVDTRWDPPVTLGVRLMSVGDDSLQHAGQAAYVRGLFGING